MTADRRILYAGCFLRALATGLIGVVLGFHLAELHFSASTIGAVVSAGLAGAMTAVVFVTVWSDRMGHGRVLTLMALLAGAGGLAVAASSRPFLVGAAAFLGMVNGMGRDRGGALALEQALLPATVSDKGRTYVFARSHMLQDAGHALGSLLAGLPALLGQAGAPWLLASSRGAIGWYAALSLAPCLLYRRLSREVEPLQIRQPLRLSPESRGLLLKISSLFALDGLGGGLLTTALLSYFFHDRFGVTASEVGVLFFGARLANAASYLGAAWLARRIGLVNTMVWTHMPSSLLLIGVAAAPSFPVAALLLLLREGLVEMDVPARQSYLMAVVRPEERTAASGVTHLVRLGTWAAGPALAGIFMDRLSLMTPLLVAAAMKTAYDLLFYLAFRRVRPPEERV